MDFPLVELLDEHACYAKLLDLLHPLGLACPTCQAPDGRTVHRRHRDPVIDYRCKHCRRIFNVFTGTPLQGTHRRPGQILLILRGVAQGTSTAQLARELGVSRGHLLGLRHTLQARALAASEFMTLTDEQIEADEVFQNAGEKGIPHVDPKDPPRHRGNKGQGHGAWDSDRAPLLGVVGRTTGRLRLHLARRMWGVILVGFVLAMTGAGTMVYTDEWVGYRRLPLEGRGHKTVCHSAGEWARDDDHDGVREVHTNTLEGIWTGFRNYIRTFRGVSKWYMDQYAAMFEWGHNLKVVTADFLRILLGCPVTTKLGT